MWFWTLKVFEVEFHAYLLEVRHFLYHYSVNLFELYFFVNAVFVQFEYEKLVLSLLLHNQMFTAYNCQPLFAFRLSYTDNLVGLSCFCRKQFNRNYSNLLKCFSIEDFDFINLTNQKAIKLRQTKTKSTF